LGGGERVVEQHRTRKKDWVMVGGGGNGNKNWNSSFIKGKNTTWLSKEGCLGKIKG